MTNEELLAALKVEIGWLRNELIRMRDSVAQIETSMRDLDRKIEQLSQ